MRFGSAKLALWMLNGVTGCGVLIAAAMLALNPPAADTDALRDDLQQIQRDAASARRIDNGPAQPMSFFAATWDAPIRGVPPVTDAETPEAPPTRSLPKLETILALEMIIGDGSSLRYKEPRTDTDTNESIRSNDTRLVLVNEKIPGITPMAVIRNVHAFAAPPRIDISYRGETVSLELAQSSIDLSNRGAEDSAIRRTAAVPYAGPAAVTLADRARQRASTRSATGAYETRPGEWVIPDSETLRLADRAGSILAETEISSHRVDGKPAGIKLDHVAQGSLILQRGFRQGDIVQRINGQAVNSQTDLLEWARQNHDQTRMVRIELLRRGQAQRLSFRVLPTRL